MVARLSEFVVSSKKKVYYIYRLSFFIFIKYFFLFPIEVSKNCFSIYYNQNGTSSISMVARLSDVA